MISDLVGAWRRHQWGEPLEALAVSRGDRDVGVQAHPALSYAAGRRFLGDVLVGRLDPVAEPPPALARLRAGRDARLD